MDITAYQEAIRRGKTVDFRTSIKKWGCLGLLLFVTGCCCTMMAIAIIISLCIYKYTQGFLSAQTYSDARGFAALFVIPLFLIWFLVSPPKVLSVNKEGIILYTEIDLTLWAKIPNIFIPWREILSIRSGTLEEKRYGMRTYSTSCLVLKCIPSTVQAVQQHCKQVLPYLSGAPIPDEFSEIQITGESSSIKISKLASGGGKSNVPGTYEVVNDLIVLPVGSYFTIPASNLLALLQQLHKDAITDQQ